MYDEALEVLDEIVLDHLEELKTLVNDLQSQIK